MSNLVQDLKRIRCHIDSLIKKYSHDVTIIPVTKPDDLSEIRT